MVKRWMDGALVWFGNKNWMRYASTQCSISGDFGCYPSYKRARKLMRRVEKQIKKEISNRNDPTKGSLLAMVFNVQKCVELTN